jgi:hypothetical protein
MQRCRGLAQIFAGEKPLHPLDLLSKDVTPLGDQRGERGPRTDPCNRTGLHLPGQFAQDEELEG